MKIIIVEDEICIREGIQKLLSKISSQYEVLGVADNGEDGLRLAKQFHPDLIITDIKMPKMDGLEMLTELYQHECDTQAIVLSAYSDFQYAQKAIEIGVKEYILKPVDYQSLAKAMLGVQSTIAKKKVVSNLIEHSLESMLVNLLTSADEQRPKTEMVTALLQQFHLTKDQSFVEILFYLGNDFERSHAKLKEKLQEMFLQWENLAAVLVEIPENKMIVGIFPKTQELDTLKKILQFRIGFLERTCCWYDANCGLIEASDFSQLKTAYHNLLPYMDWNVIPNNAQNRTSLIDYRKVSQVKTASHPDQTDLERAMKASICSYQGQPANKLLVKFIESFSGNEYGSTDIKESFIRFLWVIIQTAKETGNFHEKNFSQQQLLSQITAAKNMKELEQIAQSVLSLVQLDSPSVEVKYSLMVKRTKDLIQKRYATGITLEEIATMLHVTPEYLGTQFHKEVGMTFGAYNKECRMEKAKKLLIGTSKKLNEIANEVGYADARYFGKVFREFTGQLPAEYRRTNR